MLFEPEFLLALLDGPGPVSVWGTSSSVLYFVFGAPPPITGTQFSFPIFFGESMCGSHSFIFTAVFFLGLAPRVHFNISNMLMGLIHERRRLAISFETVVIIFVSFMSPPMWAPRYLAVATTYDGGRRARE